MGILEFVYDSYHYRLEFSALFTFEVTYTTATDKFCQWSYTMWGNIQPEERNPNMSIRMTPYALYNFFDKYVNTPDKVGNIQLVLPSGKELGYKLDIKLIIPDPFDLGNDTIYFIPLISTTPNLVIDHLRDIVRWQEDVIQSTEDVIQAHKTRARVQSDVIDKHKDALEISKRVIADQTKLISQQKDSIQLNESYINKYDRYKEISDQQYVLLDQQEKIIHRLTIEQENNSFNLTQLSDKFNLIINNLNEENEQLTTDWRKYKEKYEELALKVCYNSTLYYDQLVGKIDNKEEYDEILRTISRKLYLPPYH